MADDRTEKLREAARHRGLKLLSSRRRKPGSGDHGRFGLTDAAGKALLGVGKDGLTASPDDIAAYLRKGAAATWAESARTTPARARRKREEAPASAPAPPPPPPPKRKAKASPQAVENAPPEPAPEPERPEPTLAIRRAKAGDAGAIAALIAGEEADVRRAMRGTSAVFVADRGGLVGCAACQPVVTPQHGVLGRITLVFVNEDERRRGIGTALVEAARAHLDRQGCARIEAMSDIELRNAHGFFRALGFQQSSYRFTIG